jgi:hypothetical protein
LLQQTRHLVYLLVLLILDVLRTVYRIVDLEVLLLCAQILVLCFERCVISKVIVNLDIRIACLISVFYPASPPYFEEALTSADAAANVVVERVAASNAVEVLDIGVHLAFATERRSRQSGSLYVVEGLARFWCWLVLSQRSVGVLCGCLLRRIVVFALRCTVWRRDGRLRPPPAVTKAGGGFE